MQAQSSTVRRRPRWSSVASNVLDRHAVRFSAGADPVHAEGERHFVQLVREKRRRPLPETRWTTLGCRLGKVGARGRQSVYVVSEAEWTRRVDQRYNGGYDNNLWQDRANPFEGAHAACAHVSDRARSLRAMHRLLRALLEAELERWRGDQREHDGRHEPDLAAISLMSRKLHHFFKSCIRHTQPTPLRASNAPNNSMHTRMFLSRKTKASSAPLHPLMWIV